MSNYGLTSSRSGRVGVFPNMPIEVSDKKWQNTFFYVRNIGGRADAINLPPFFNEQPLAKKN